MWKSVFRVDVARNVAHGGGDLGVGLERSIRKVEELLKSDPEIAATVRDITSNINSKN